MVANRIIIAGGGIAGLAAALSLADLNFSVILYEKAANLQELGAGIQLGPNATRILRQWGLLQEVAAYAFAPEFIQLKSGRSGRKVTSLPLAHFVTNHWDAPYFTLHRADLQKVLLQAVINHPLIELHCGHEVTRITGNLDEGFEVEIAHQGQETKQKTGLFIACDGVWSRARAHPPLQERARNSGFVAWRATCRHAQLPTSFLTVEKYEDVHVFMGEKGHFIAYPIRQGQEFNFVAIVRFDETDRAQSGQPHRSFTGWACPVRDILSCVEDWTYWPLFTMQRPRFIGARGEIFLGDSAHATTPFAAQGAALAIEDGAALARALSLAGMDLKAALQLFSQKRLKRVNAVNRRGSFNQFVYHAAFPLSCFRNIFMAYRKPERFLSDLDWLYNHDVAL